MQVIFFIIVLWSLWALVRLLEADDDYRRF